MDEEKERSCEDDEIKSYCPLRQYLHLGWDGMGIRLEGKGKTNSAVCWDFSLILVCQFL